jgi:hypothetical protein
MQRCAALFVVAGYAKVRLTPQALLALPLALLKRLTSLIPQSGGHDTLQLSLWFNLMISRMLKIKRQ